MIYFLDVNALLALGYLHHQFHTRVTAWIETENFPDLLTCSITELGFIRILSQQPYGLSVEEAKILLANTKRKKRPSFRFVADANDVSLLPSWVRTSKHTTDGHLLALAKAHGAVLATLDEHIPGAYVIPRIN